MIIYFKENKKVFFLLFTLTFLYYGNSLRNKYSLDDDYVTVTNFPVKGKEKEYVPNHNLVSKGFKGILKIFKSRYAHDTDGAFDYRPITTVTFAIEYAIFGQSPFISHFINILIYFFSIWLIFCNLFKLLEQHENKLNIAFICALLFLIHPIHTEVVNNIKCRDELLAFSFSMLALCHCFKIYEKFTFKNLFLIALFLSLGLLSKKSAILFIGIMPLCFVFYRKFSVKYLYVILSAGLFALLIVFFLKLNVVTEEIKRNFYHFENPLYTEHFSLFQKLIIALKSFGFYTKLFIFPYPLRFYYGGNLIDFSTTLDVNAFVGLLYILLSIYIIIRYKNKLFIFATLLYLGCIFPFVNFASPSPGLIAERFVYSASLGFCLIITSGLLILFNKNFKFQSYSQLLSKPMMYVTPVIIISMIYTWNRNADWKNKLTLFENDIPHLENSAKANSLIANEYFELLRIPNKKYPGNVLVQKCIKYYTQAVKNDSSIYSAYNNVGVVYYSFLNDMSNAKKYFSLAIRHRPLYSQAYENIGNCYKQEKNIKKALECYKKAIVISPKQYSAFMAAINMSFENKLYNQSINFIQIANTQFPNSYELTAQEANCYFMKKDTVTALQKYDEAYNLNPNPSLAQFISTQALKKGDTTLYKKYMNF